MKQRVIVPSYWPDFSCIASSCEETCCAGWYIAIDEAAYKKYKKVKQPEMKKRLDKEIVARKGTVSPDCVAKIKLKNNRCAFLAKDNLCDIYRNLGENYLSETCRVYPRNVNKVGDKLELSLALSCPEAARRILLCKEPISFAEEDDTYHLPVVGGTVSAAAALGKVKHFEEAVVMIRAYLVAILQNRALTFKERWQQLEQAFNKLDQIKKKQDIKALIALLGDEKTKQPSRSKEYESYNKEQETAKMEKLWEALLTMRSEKKWPSVRYEACYLEMVNGLEVSAENSDKKAWSKEKYMEGSSRFEKKLAVHWSVIFENYFVSYIYERLIPLDQKTPKESFKEMTFYGKMLKLHLVGMLMEKEEVRQEDVVTLIQSFTRVFDHNELCKDQLKKIILKSEQ